MWLAGQPGETAPTPFHRVPAVVGGKKPAAGGPALFPALAGSFPGPPAWLLLPARMARTRVTSGQQELCSTRAL